MLRGAAHVGFGTDRKTREHLRFGEIGRKQRRHRQQHFAQRCLGCAQQQPMSALGDHDGIDDQRRGGGVFAERGNNRLDHLGAVQHAGLHGVSADVGKHNLDLLGNEGRLDCHDAMHAFGVLGGQRRDRRRGESIHGGHRLDVRLDPRPAAGIRAGNDQNTTPHAPCWGIASMI